MKALAILLVCTPALAAETSTAKPVLDAWLRAQNERNFTAYSALYAPTFSGVRRVGRRSLTLDHDAWLRDRRRMFAHAMTVDATDLISRTTKEGVELSFTQVFASGTFSDRGPKVMTIVGDRIVREEMLESKVTVARDDVHVPVDTFAFVVDGMLVVEPESSPATERVVRRLRRVKGDSWMIEMRGALDVKRLPPNLAALRGRRYRVFDVTGETCVAHVGAFYVRAMVEAVDDPERTVLPKTLSDVNDGLPVRTIAELVAEKGTCAGSWARAENVAAPVVVASKNDAAYTIALDALRALPEYEKAQHAYVAAKAEMLKSGDLAAPAPGRWDELPGAMDSAIFPTDKGAIVWLRVDAGDGCGGVFAWSLEAIFEVSDTSTVLRYEGPGGYALAHPTALADLDGDGVPELIVDKGESDGYLDGAVLQLTDARYRMVTSLTWPRRTCHC